MINPVLLYIEGHTGRETMKDDRQTKVEDALLLGKIDSAIGQLYRSAMIVSNTRKPNIDNDFGRWMTIMEDARTAISSLKSDLIRLRADRDHWRKLAEESSEIRSANEVKG